MWRRDRASFVLALLVGVLVGPPEPGAANPTEAAAAVSVGRPAVTSALQISPVAFTCPVSSSGSSTSRYSRMCRIGFSHLIFKPPSTDG